MSNLTLTIIRNLASAVFGGVMAWAFGSKIAIGIIVTMLLWRIINGEQ